MAMAKELVKRKIERIRAPIGSLTAELEALHEELEARPEPKPPAVEIVLEQAQIIGWDVLPDSGT